MDLAPEPADVVEALQFAHTRSRVVLQLAESLATRSATLGAADAARTVLAHVQELMPLHFEDEEQSLAPRLAGRHPVVDGALARMKAGHFRLSAILARVATYCGLVAEDPAALHARRFQLAGAVRDLRRELEPHQAQEESIVFPAVKRLLYREDIDDIRREMDARRAVVAAVHAAARQIRSRSSSTTAASP